LITDYKKTFFEKVFKAYNLKVAWTEPLFFLQEIGEGVPLVNTGEWMTFFLLKLVLFWDTQSKPIFAGSLKDQIGRGNLRKIILQFKILTSFSTILLLCTRALLFGQVNIFAHAFCQAITSKNCQFSMQIFEQVILSILFGLNHFINHNLGKITKILFFAGYLKTS
jgi:hypothetical protein